MKLPVAPATPDDATLWRRYADLLADRLLAVGDAVDLPYGRGVLDGDHGTVLPPTALPPDAWPEIAAALHTRGAEAITWIVPPGDAAVGRSPTSAVRAVPHALYRLARSRLGDMADAPGLTVLPGRAARAWYERVCPVVATPDDPLARHRAAHLDDPQFDGMVVLAGGAALAVGGLQSRGQTGGIFDLGVVPERRRAGVGRFLLGRLLELAGRSQLADVFAGVIADDVAAVALFEGAGFVRTAAYTVMTTSQSK